MFCTHCGADDQSDKAYCKRCGKWLGAAPPEKRLIVMLVFNLLSALFGAASAIALYASYLGTTAKPAVYVAAAFCIVISVYQSISFSFTLGLLVRARKARTDTQRVIEAKGVDHTPRLEAAETDALIDGPSVTENTTDLLEPVARRPVRSDWKRTT